jgi:hypothetical protein
VLLELSDWKPLREAILVQALEVANLLGEHVGYIPSDLVRGISTSLLDLLLGGLGGVWSHMLLGLGGEIFAACVRHIDSGWLIKRKVWCG